MNQNAIIRYPTIQNAGIGTFIEDNSWLTSLMMCFRVYRLFFDETN